MGLQNDFCLFDFFFQKDVFKPYERPRRVDPKNRSPMSLNLTHDLKKSQRSKKWTENRLFMTFNAWVRNSKKLLTSHLVETFCLSSETIFGTLK